MSRSLLITIKNVPELVAAQGGATGSLAQKIVPGTIEAKVYDTMRAKLASALTEQGVKADVQVVAPDGMVPAGGSPIWKPVAIGAGGFLLFVLGRAIVRRFR